MKNEKGFTLIEVLASVVIITIILFSFSRIFILNNQYANESTEKLVIMNLADAQLERLRVMATKVENNAVFPNIKMNGRTYEITVRTSQTVEEKNLNIQNVKVDVNTIDSKMSTTVEGYVMYDEEVTK